MIEHDWKAVPHRYERGKWMGQFHAPGLGIRWVRDSAGIPIVYDSPEAAYEAACKAYKRAINGPKRPPVEGKPRFVNARARALGGRAARLVFQS